MSWINVGYNQEEGGYTSIRAHFPRVPCQGERVEFRDPEGGATNWPPDLDGNVFYVAEVCWVANTCEGGPTAEATIFVVPKAEWEG